MLQVEERIDPLRAELPEFSVDWRFLLPVQPGMRLLVLTETGHDFSEDFAALGIQAVSCQALAAGTGLPTDTSEGATEGLGRCLIAPGAELPFAPASFEAVAIPLGIPAGLAGSPPAADQIAGAKRLLRPGGALLLGFSNRWGWPRRGPRPGIAVTPGYIQGQVREAGFGRSILYGAAPSLGKPAYILPLRQSTIRFFLRHRFLGRRGGGLIRMLPVPTTLASRMLPCYFLLAEA